MPFPPTDREVYQKNPLREVICQLRFPTILQVTAESPARFQDVIRSLYPLYSQENPTLGLAQTPGIPKEVANFLAALPMPQGLQQPVHKFSTGDGTRAISLSQDFIAVSEKQYRRWEDFREEFKRAETAFRDIYHPAFYSRIGLRYRNILDRTELGLEGRPWGELLNTAFIGELGADVIADEVQEIRTQSLLRLPDIETGLVRVQHGLATTADAGNRKQVYVIDADFYKEVRCDLDDAIQILDTFNNWGGRLFRWAITPKLRRALGPGPV